MVTSVRLVNTFNISFTSPNYHLLFWWEHLRSTLRAIFKYSVQFSCSVMSDSLQPHGLQHASLPCPSPSPGVCSNLCPLSQWCHPTISSSVIPFSSWLQSFPAIRVFSHESVHIRWPKCWSFSLSISPSNKYSGLISFRMDWLDLLAVQGAEMYIKGMISVSPDSCIFPYIEEC